MRRLAWILACAVLAPCAADLASDLPISGDGTSDGDSHKPDDHGVTQVTPADLPSRPVTFVGAGDIAKCGWGTFFGWDPHQKTAEIVLSYPPDTPVFTLGDNVYSDGTPEEFKDCYAKSWGKFKDRTYPSAGNHDYNTTDAAGYFGYFGARAGEPRKGYYSYDLGAWHVVVLNSNCSYVKCDAESAQVAWLKQDLADHPRRCTLAYWHAPRFSSDRGGDARYVEPFYQALYDANADLILSGNSHNYERFVALTPKGEPDPVRGIRQFVVGTGGASLRERATYHVHSEVFAEEHGIMELTLEEDGYRWRFVAVPGSGFTDVGADSCH